MKQDNQFDRLAVSYYNCVPDLPQSYITLLQRTFRITHKDHIIDLGCGSGDLTLSLAKTSSFVHGIDISHIMINIAKQKDIAKRISWINKSVADYDFGTNRYDLMIAIEAFHLFANRKQLIKRFASALQDGGFLCIGWVVYEWEPALSEIIKQTFAEHGYPLNDWGIWACPTFSQDVKDACEDFSPVQTKEIQISASTSIDVIIEYLFSISPTYYLNPDIKPQLRKKLKKRFLNVYPSGLSRGRSSYIIAFTKKLPAKSI